MPLPSRLRGACALLCVLAAGPAMAHAGLFEPRAGDRILVVAPHPDDETLCCAGILQRAAAAGAQVGVVWLTAGDGARFNAVLARLTPRSTGGQMLRLGQRRLDEAAAAASVLGVPHGTAYFLGYPDRGLRRLLDPAVEQPLRSRYTGRSQIPYARALSAQENVTAARLHADLAEVVERFQPTWILAPAPEDRHPDHRAAGLLVQQVAAASHRPAGLAFYVIHGGRHWPAPRGLKPDLAMRAAPAIAAGPLLSFELTAEERGRKAEALRQHRTQMRRMARFLNAFVRSNELFVVREPPEAQDEA